VFEYVNRVNRIKLLLSLVYTLSILIYTFEAGKIKKKVLHTRGRFEALKLRLQV
jgi:hypothetical protein